MWHLPGRCRGVYYTICCLISTFAALLCTAFRCLSVQGNLASCRSWGEAAVKGLSECNGQPVEARCFAE